MAQVMHKTPGSIHFHSDKCHYGTLHTKINIVATLTPWNVLPPPPQHILWKILCCISLTSTPPTMIQLPSLVQFTVLYCKITLFTSWQFCFMMAIIMDWRGDGIDARVSFFNLFIPPSIPLHIRLIECFVRFHFQVILGGPFIRLGGGLFALEIEIADIKCEFSSSFVSSIFLASFLTLPFPPMTSLQ